jgi:hypothetical protein
MKRFAVMACPFMLLLVVFQAPEESVAQDASGLNDLVIYDAGQHYRDLPAVNFAPVPGGAKVEIVPKVHVHRYYYSGDKTFQGPLIGGGPVTVVAKHPVTNKQLYIDVNLPSGAPSIRYTGRAITYVYQDRRVRIAFPRWTRDRDHAVVSYHEGQGTFQSARQFHEEFSVRTREKLRDLAAVQAGSELATDVAEVTRGVHQVTSRAVGHVLSTASTMLDAIPGVVPLKSLAEPKGEDVDTPQFP